MPRDANYVASATVMALHPVISTRRAEVIGDDNASSTALGGRLTGDNQGTVVRARVAKGTHVVVEGGRQEAPLAAPIVEIPVTCYQVNGSSSWSILWIAISKLSSPSVVLPSPPDLIHRSLLHGAMTINYLSCRLNQCFPITSQIYCAYQ
jgi:hypothetical protein